MITRAGNAVPTAIDVDLRRAPLADLRRIRFRDPARDFVADEIALWDRLQASWAGLDDAAWRLPGAAPSDAGGPPWSLLDHVAHVVDWQEIAAGYIERAIATARWPDDADYDGGDFDRYNERRRDPWARLAPIEIRRRGTVARDALLDLVGRLPMATVRSHEAWSWVFMVLHGHYLDHLNVLEPWGDELRRRQADGDPFGDDPFGTLASPEATRAFFDAAVATLAQFVELVGTMPVDRWEGLEVTPGWSLADHVGHVAAWLEEAIEALDGWAAGRGWLTYEETEDEWNARTVVEWRRVAPAERLERLIVAHDAVVARARGLEPEVLWSFDGLGWTYEVLHGHVRKHLALAAPVVIRDGWPPEPAPGGRA